MNIYKILNEITFYIDEHLEEKIEYSIFAKMMGVNLYTMQRIFSVITGITLTEYIRKRRLSCAAYDLFSSRLKVMDVALKYQYENATSFSRAFKNFHGIKPSEITKKTKLKEFPRVIYDENIKNKTDIEYSIVEREKLILYGFRKETNNREIGKDAPLFFERIEKKYLNDYGKIKYGMVVYRDFLREECNYYYVLYDKKIDGACKVLVPAGKWLSFRINSQDAIEIQKASHQFYLDFLPSCNYDLRDLGELEYYHDGIVEFLVPIL